MKLKKYIIYGFKVDSELELNAISAEFENADICITYGSINYPPRVEGATNEDIIFRANSIKIRTYDAGFFEIINNDQIIVEPLEGIGTEFLSLYLLALVMSILMYQRKEFPLHAGTVSQSGVCFSLVGHSGAGKTALSAGFIQRGFKLLSDDVTRLVEYPDHLQAVHSFLSQKICQDTAELLNIEYNTERRIIQGLDKYYIEDVEMFEQMPQKLTAIIEIVPSDVLEPQIVTLTNKEKLDLVLDHTFGQEFMSKHNHLVEHFKFCVRIINKTQIVRLLRPKKLFTVSEQIEVICNHFAI